MNNISLSRGMGSTRIQLDSSYIGNDLVICIFNEKGHIGAVAIGEFDFKNERASVSVVTRLGHKDDSIAQKAAYLITRSTRKTVCVVAGVHLDDIIQTEIIAVMENAIGVIDELVDRLQ